MSAEKNISEARRWLKTAEDDLEAALVLFENSKLPYACFLAQQAGEKALKAVWYAADADPWCHSVLKLVNDLEEIDLKLYARLRPLKKSAGLLDKFYIPTRYPNGLPDLTPAEVYNVEDAASGLDAARKIISASRELTEEAG